ncbi:MULTISPECIES: hypothetical protein [Bacillus]|uniref:hypothetical protein n=1 Tax=Bacillus TaxID=1386 RepID=UPI00057C1D88|nr:MULTISPECIES: hypothetical protein [Bacillus]AUZ29792.1 hypothetical protein C1T27_05385 [Bacillus licheniformis]MBZ5212948.1 hypothetical protein [Bacillus paralicheniformis]MCY1630915.1 hypothetical protein [Bacillus paralicheniformis]MCY8180869.1 hypothetical protein [Bacillus paralicheniformis]MCY8664856.1 hypothetical protein [Bacillus haynesii]
MNSNRDAMMSDKNSRFDSEVVTWKMTEEERLAYIKKHPIIPEEQPSPTYEWKTKEGKLLP